MKKILFVLFLFVCFFSFKINSYALDIGVDEITNVYVERNIFGRFSQTMLHKYNIDGISAYCIMPGVAFENGDYSISTEEILSKEDKMYIEAVASFSYGYSDSKDIYYYMAAQQLIWERLGITDIKWKKGLFSDYYYKVDGYKNDILRKVENYYTLPSFANSTIDILSNRTFDLTDKNNIINTYNNNNVTVYDNTVSIMPPLDFIGSYNISFNKEINYNTDTKYYVKDGSQTIGLFGVSYPPEFNLNVNVSGGYIKLYKLDFDTGTNNSIGAGNLENAKYEVYNINDVLVDTLITDINGYAISKELPYANYYIKEVKAPEGYILDNNIYNINLDSETAELNVYDKIITEKWNIKKYYGSYITNEFYEESGAAFEIYDWNEKLVDTYISNDNGNIDLDLVYGKYKVKQISGKDQYLFVDDFYINIDGNNTNNIVNLFNEKYSVKIKINKLDKISKKLINDITVFKIKNMDTDQFIKNSNDSYLFETNKDGILYTDIYLESGNYALIEENAPYGYKEVSLPISFVISDKNETITDNNNIYYEINIYNERLEKIPQTASNDYMPIISIILFISGIFIKRYYYAY